MSYDAEITQDFLIESYEMLDTLDESFVALEEDPSDTVVLGSIFRVMHTIKGTCGFLGFNELEELAHKGENLLSLLREGEKQLDTDVTDALLATVDRIRQFLEVIEQTGSDQGVAIADLVDVLVALAEGRPTDDDGPTVADDGAAEPADTTADDTSDGGAIDEAHDQPDQAERLGDILVEDHDIDRTNVEIAAAEQALGDERPIGEILAESGGATERQVDAALAAQAADGRRSAAESTIRVDVQLLDDLMNLVGELVLARNEILQFVTDSSDGAFGLSTQRLDLLTTELQEQVMKTRMQPIGGLWSKLPRVVRDLAHQCGKRVRLEMEGKETELDKSLIESIKDPLTHIVRNTVDHGIEDPEARAEAGKPPEGVLRLSAGHQDGHVVITIADDGAGIDLDRVKAKAVERGLVTSEAAATMRDAEAVQLIFLPGFSTAAKVTNVSGRGVGMDVVKTNIEKIGGSVECRTERGVGTTFKIEIPLTLAIVPALVVTCNDRRYAIPQRSLVELVSVDGTDDGHSVEFVHDAPVIRLRDRLLPVVDLRQVLGEPARDALVGDMVVLTADGRQFSVLVDNIVETQEIVVKPLGRVVNEVEMFSGATILGDGRVALILDVIGLGHQAHVVTGRTEAATSERGGDSDGPGAIDTSETLLLMSVGNGRRIAMALSDVERLDEFEAGQIELSGHRQVVQYRGQIMPLVDLASDLGYGGAMMGDIPDRVNVVVYKHKGRDIGLVIDQMIDIIDHQQTASTASGNLIVMGKVTEMVDASQLPSLMTIEREFNLEEVGV